MQATQLQTEHFASPSSPDPATRLIGPIMADRMEDVFPRAIELLAPALAADRWRVGVDDLKAFFLNGGMQLWVVLDIEAKEIIAALATEELLHPKSKTFSIAYLGGEQMERWTPWIQALENMARDGGCQTLRIPGRKGWARVFPDYAEAFRVFEKQLCGGEA